MLHIEKIGTDRCYTQWLVEGLSIEEMPPYGKIDLWQIPRWTSSNQFHRYGEPMTKVDPKALRKAMLTMWRKYGVEFEFCTRRQSPARVIKILKGDKR